MSERTELSLSADSILLFVSACMQLLEFTDLALMQPEQETVDVPSPAAQVTRSSSTHRTCFCGLFIAHRLIVTAADFVRCVRIEMCYPKLLGLL
jgi:hypothetical protein